MGRAKREWEEAWGRGWSPPDTFVCDECVLDGYLKRLVIDAVESRRCDYCGREAIDDIAAPFSVVLDAVGGTFKRYYEDPAVAGLPRDTGEWVGEEAITDTQNALCSFGVFCSDEVFEEIVNSFTNDDWYPCADGHWMGTHPNEELGYAWDHFVHEVKHVCRYFFSQTPASDVYDPSETLPPLVLLNKIRDLIGALNLIREIDAEVDVFRVREVSKTERLSGLADIGPPPSVSACAGRMNPAGVSYCYLALERRTVLGEVIKRPPCHAAIGHLRLRRSARLVDLTKLPPMPSIFDPDRWEEREHIIFLQRFVEAISQPIAKDGREHVDYVPSQIVSEYLAQTISPDHPPFDGVLFPSTVIPRGNNVVLFPPRSQLEDWATVLVVVNIEHIGFGTWTELIAELIG